MAGDEYYEAKGALLWLPEIKRVVDEAIGQGVVQPSEKALAENMMLGVVGVESGGANPFIKRPHGYVGPEGAAVSSDGLTQLIRHHLYSNENPFDPLTNLRAGLRTLWRYYRGYGNRWDLALMEHLTGDVSNPGKIDDAGFMSGGAYPGRVIQIVSKAKELLAKGDTEQNADYFTQNADGLTQQGMGLAPSWGIFDSPNLPFNWVPPVTSRAYELLTGNTTQPDYYAKVKAAGVNLLLGNNDNPGTSPPMPNPGVMFEEIPSPVYSPRQPSPAEAATVTQNAAQPAVKGVNYTSGGFHPQGEKPWYTGWGNLVQDTGAVVSQAMPKTGAAIAGLADNPQLGQLIQTIGESPIGQMVGGLVNGVSTIKRVPSPTATQVPAGAASAPESTSTLLAMLAGPGYGPAVRVPGGTIGTPQDNSDVNTELMAPIPTDIPPATPEMVAQWKAGAGIPATPAASASALPTFSAEAGLTIPDGAVNGNEFVPPLHTEGKYIVDARGQPVKLASVALGGMGSGVPFNVWKQGHSIPVILDGIKAAGFNSIRLPISFDTYVYPGKPPWMNGSDLGVNHPELANSTPIEVLDYVLNEAAKRKIGVILDMHKIPHDNWTDPLWYQGVGAPDAQSNFQFFGLNDPNNKWNGQASETDMATVWNALATRYANNPAVIGADLFNEPHAPATWGDGGPTDWRRAAEHLGSAVQSAAPNWLVIVEGIGADTVTNKLGDAWWGGNLNNVATAPVRLNNVVYSPHDYSSSVWGNWWLSDPSAMRELWERSWGYIARNNIAPIWLGEFGGRDLRPETGDGKQVHMLLDYLDEIGGSWSYWIWHDEASADTGGLVPAGSMEVPFPEKIAVLQPYMGMTPDWGQGVLNNKTGFNYQWTTFDPSRPGFPPQPPGVSIVSPPGVVGATQTLKTTADVAAAPVVATPAVPVPAAPVQPFATPPSLPSSSQPPSITTSPAAGLGEALAKVMRPISQKNYGPLARVPGQQSAPQAQPAPLTLTAQNAFAPQSTATAPVTAPSFKRVPAPSLASPSLSASLDQVMQAPPPVPALGQPSPTSMLTPTSSAPPTVPASLTNMPDLQTMMAMMQQQASVRNPFLQMMIQDQQNASNWGLPRDTSQSSTPPKPSPYGGT